MPDNLFKSREQAFEAVYFAKLDAELIKKIHDKSEAADARTDLANASGISSEALLDSILELGVTTSNLEAMGLVPLIWVAWANGTLTQDECTAALKVAEAEGIGQDTPSHLLLETWLAHMPDATLFDTWREYIASLLGELDAPAREQIRKDVLERAEKIARASGGMLGVGSISKKERKVLGEIEAAMS
jgi:hypothetical protein